LGRRPVRERDVLTEGEQRDDRLIGCRSARFLDGDAEVVDQGERLEPEKIDPALQQAVDGLAERAPYGRVVEVEQVPRGRAERTDGTRHEHIAPDHVTSLARELATATRKATGLIAEAERGEPRSIRPEGG
jgi:hypothetical protein